MTKHSCYKHDLESLFLVNFQTRIQSMQNRMGRSSLDLWNMQVLVRALAITASARSAAQLLLPFNLRTIHKLLFFAHCYTASVGFVLPVRPVFSQNW